MVRQVKHSPNARHDALDLVLFLNGIAVATVELKSNFTQSVHDGRPVSLRPPSSTQGRRVGASAGLPRRRAGALRGEPVEVMMTTRLASKESSLAASTGPTTVA